MSQQPRYLCMHGHFYQPPRENPWLEEVEVQDSAAPFHDWNARIAAECYGPNSAPRILTPDRKIAGIGCNYSNMSFNFGPTLLSWMEREAKDAYARVLLADKTSVAEHHGHGSAMAQVYNHVIMPLASQADKVTQVRWGIRDFQHRFGRDPEGMWLAECAVDTPTLMVLADHGIKFTVLSPFQAGKVKEPGGEWVDVAGGRIDPTRGYDCVLPNGKRIALFFYDGPIAKSMAFEDGLQDSSNLLDRIASGYADFRQHPQLLNIATDGETFGHHKKQGDEVLAWVFARAGERGITLCNYAEYLAMHPPAAEVQILEGTSWSCAHGVERWRSDCGCKCSGEPHWTQGWRGPLRAALDLLREHLEEIFEDEGQKLFKDPWEARDLYVDVVLDRSPENVNAFLARVCGRILADDEQVRALKLLESQRHAMLMYTSCGWFFSELSGLETVQILKYAARAMQLANDVGETNLEPIFLEALEKAPSNLPELGNGKVVYERYVRPSIVGMNSVAAHVAISGIFDDKPGDRRVAAFDVSHPAFRKSSAGPATLAVGRLRLVSTITREQRDLSYAVLHFGGSDVRASVRPFQSPEAHQQLEDELFRRFNEFSLVEVVRGLDESFDGRGYTLRDLFVDERRRMIDLMLKDSLGRNQSDFERIFDENLPLMHFLKEINTPIPAPLRAATQVTLSSRASALLRQLGQGPGRVATAHGALIAIDTESKRLGVPIDYGNARARFERMLTEKINALIAQPSRRAARELHELLSLAQQLALSPNLWEVQNRYYDFLMRGAGDIELDITLQLAERLYFERAAIEPKVREARAARPRPEQAPVRPITEAAATA